MSIATNTDWEIRTTGSPTNGGGFKDLNPGTSVDYSQQDSAQLSLSDIASNGAGTGISSTTGGFTAAMEGNCIYISGTGFTTGWYQITGYTDTNNITIDRSCGISQTGGTGNVGGAWMFADPETTTFFNATNKSNYNKCHIKAGTYSSCWVSPYNNISAAYLRLEGYNTTRGDCPTGTNRPFFNFGNDNTYLYITAGYSWFSNIRFDSTYSSSALSVIYASTAGTTLTFRNCKVTRSGFSNAFCMRLAGNYNAVIQCELVCTSGTGIRFENARSSAIYCYIHDSANGILYSGASAHSTTVENCVIDTCTTYGLDLYYAAFVGGNTIYNCGTGLRCSSTYNHVVNNIFKSCTTGINSAEYTYDDNNCYHGNTAERTGGVVAGPNNITSDPLLADPANGDFTLGAGSPCFDAGIKLGAGVGL